MTRCDVKSADIFRLFAYCVHVLEKAAGLRGLRPALQGLGGVVERRAATLDG